MGPSSDSDARDGKRPRRRWIIGAIAMALGVFLLLFQWREARPALPDHLGAYALVRVLSGHDARQMVDRLHASSVAPTDNVIGEYRRGERRATVYVSMYDDDRLPELRYAQMRERLAATSTPFQELSDRTLGPLRYSTCVGVGQRHYFFAVERRLVWLAIDPPDADTVFEEYCSMAVD